MSKPLWFRITVARALMAGSSPLLSAVFSPAMGLLAMLTAVRVRSAVMSMMFSVITSFLANHRPR